MSWDVCRICLSGSDKMYSIINTQLQDICEKITNHQWNREGWPDTVCYICISQLRRSFKLREISKESEEIFAQFFASGFDITEETVPMLNKRKLHKLEVTPLQSFTTGFIPNVDEGVTVKLENESDIVLEDVSSLQPNKTLNNVHIVEVIRPTSQNEVIKDGIIKNTNNLSPKSNISHEEIGKDTEHSADKNNTRKYIPLKKDTEKKELDNMPRMSLNDNDKLNSHSYQNINENTEPSSLHYQNPNENIEPKPHSYQNENSETNTHGYQNQIQTKPSIKTKKPNEIGSDTKINIDNSQESENRNTRSIGFTLKFNTNKINSRTLLGHSRKRPLPLGVFQSNELKTPYNCQYCDETFTFKFSLEEHMTAHKEKYFCHYCDESFNLKSLLKVHKRSHEKLIECEECPKKFNRLSHLNQHSLSHSNQKSYKCEHCEKRFAQISNLNQHIRTHTGQKPYKCDTCDKSFKQLSNLLQHQRVHTKEKPYRCHICFKKFAQQSTLVQHRRIHYDEKPYDCTYCDKAFRQKSNLQQHIKSFHVEDN